MPLFDDVILARVDAVAPGLGAAVLAEVATIEAEAAAERCLTRNCGADALGGTCGDCPQTALIFEGFLADPVLEITSTGRDLLDRERVPNTVTD